MANESKLYLVSDGQKVECFFDYNIARSRYFELIDLESGKRVYRYILEQVLVEYILRPTSLAYEFDHDVDRPLTFGLSLRVIWCRLPANLRQFLFDIASKRISCFIKKVKPTPTIEQVPYDIDKQNIEYTFNTVLVEIPVDK